MTYFFWLHVHGLRGTRRAQIFFYVPYEPKASIGKTHGRNSLAPAARTFSHFLSLTLNEYYFYGPIAAEGGVVLDSATLSYIQLALL